MRKLQDSFCSHWRFPELPQERCSVIARHGLSLEYCFIIKAASHSPLGLAAKMPGCHNENKRPWPCTEGVLRMQGWDHISASISQEPASCLGCEIQHWISSRKSSCFGRCRPPAPGCNRAFPFVAPKPWGYGIMDVEMVLCYFPLKPGFHGVSWIHGKLYPLSLFPKHGKMLPGLPVNLYLRKNLTLLPNSCK